MDIISIRSRIDRLINTHSSSLIPEILKSDFSCMRCGWCCCRNFDIRITENISRPSNAISIFPDDIRRIIKMTGCNWDQVAEPDIYSCLQDGKDFILIGWILRRDQDNCVFYSNGECIIYSCRPMICRCYPFFFGEGEVEIMHCENMGKKTAYENALEISGSLKRYEIKKLQNYIRIIEQAGEKLSISLLRMLPAQYSGEVLVYDGERISRCRIRIP